MQINYCDENQAFNPSNSSTKIVGLSCLLRCPFLKWLIVVCLYSTKLSKGCKEIFGKFLCWFPNLHSVIIYIKLFFFSPYFYYWFLNRFLILPSSQKLPITVGMIFQSKTGINVNKIVLFWGISAAVMDNAEPSLASANAVRDNFWIWKSLTNPHWEGG